MKILYYAPDFVVGGAWKYFKILIEGMKRKGHTLFLVGHRAPAMHDIFQKMKPFVDGVRLIEPIRSPKQGRDYIRMVKESDVLHFNFIRPNICFLPVLLARLFCRHTPLITTNHLSIPIKSHYPLKAEIVLSYTRFHFSLFDRIIVVSRACAEELQRLYRVKPNKIDVVYNGLETNPYEEPVDIEKKRQELDLPESKAVISIIGRLSLQKGHIYSFRAIEQLAKKRNDFVVIVVGEGRLEEELRREVKELGIETTVRFLGFRSDIPEILRVTDILLLTSIHEGLPFTVQEAMLSSIPVVASPVDGTPEAVSDGETGFLVPYEDSHKIAERLDELIQSPGLRRRMGASGRARALDFFSLEAMLSTTEHIYSQLVSKQ